MSESDGMTIEDINTIRELLKQNILLAERREPPNDEFWKGVLRRFDEEIKEVRHDNESTKCSDA